MGLELSCLTPESFLCVSQWTIEGRDLQGAEGTKDPPVEHKYGSTMVLPVFTSKENELVCDSSLHPENDY